MKIAFLVLYVLVSAVHLFFSWKNDKPKRAMTKWIILLALLGYYVTSTDNVSFVVVAAILTSWLGDVFLIPPGTKWFVCGGISFMLSHVFYMIAYAGNIAFSSLNWFFVIPAVVLYSVLCGLVFRPLKSSINKKMFPAMVLYLGFNGAMNCFAFMQLLSAPSLATALTYIGAIFFFISDSCLFTKKFKKDCKIPGHQFVVMLTYIIGEFLIVQGLLMI